MLHWLHLVKKTDYIDYIYIDYIYIWLHLVKKTDYDTKIIEIEKKLTDHSHDKYITTPEFNVLAADVFNATLIQSNWWQKQILMLNCQVKKNYRK